MKNKRRKILRLQDYDYAQNGFYYVTICTNKKVNLFGEILENEIHLNNAGEMVKENLYEIEKKFNDVYIDYNIIMPNHIHVIIEKRHKVGHGDPALQNIMYWYKSKTTNLYIDGVKKGLYQSFNKIFWQRSYYEHVIRGENELKEIRKYIQDNPIKDCLKDI